MTCAAPTTPYRYTPLRALRQPPPAQHHCHSTPPHPPALHFGPHDIRKAKQERFSPGTRPGCKRVITTRPTPPTITTTTRDSSSSSSNRNSQCTGRMRQQEGGIADKDMSLEGFIKSPSESDALLQSCSANH
ncbi:hypothetical protein Pcinc_036252 [Petrolisthes cinctipes]|uniref:Uncharacterized protein n=1 Tax=Petrolisthes cinctipes TaxID=88211 RepID=A0AAE1BV35_PETCI|nr:hypothetical protein Pcinc_036252 [Petrolisthes cinctipes]